ncbi:flagellar basal body L-ring protein [Meridianimarinicoccus roseus]|jgi:flagellar L-ring protein precursor FlgH|uniref:Flagellar L-ring protein n=1 Tax=Meridianimarinicoccus roseus TaxID=2072018 RepID=A0A2V2LFX3_9RHOB|nr:flagellar basal body L-ring protein FlgH [Meridianimarinicoccus roseus]PWR04365.1 flagellar basal body L-ring protein [Meridianimarinicoccus roseus]
MRPILISCALLATFAGCGRLDHVGRPPTFSPDDAGREHLAMSVQGLPNSLERQRIVDQASLWTGARNSLLGDRRAGERGDILTVVIEIDEKAEISNSTSRSRSAGENLDVPQLFGYPQRQNMPDGASAENPVSITSSSESDGDGSVRRKEKLTLRVAATITDVMPNGVMRIEGSQEVRVNFEIRELLVSGYVRPEDISRTNQITYDKIASARISYGGRGQITDVQQPRWGQQISDIILPF